MRGFSLFTPLVGTALVIMSILVATTMTENDVRFSRSISNSFAVSSQVISAKVISGKIALGVVEQIESTVYDYLTGRTLMAECNVAGDCVSDTINALESLLKIKLRSDVFDEFLDKIYIGGEYVVVREGGENPNTRIWTAVRTLLPFEFSFTQDKKLNVTIDEDAFYEDAEIPKLLYLDFRSSAYPQTMRISAIPKGLSFITDEPIKKCFEDTENALLSANNDPSGINAILDGLKGENRFLKARLEVQGDKMLLKTTWALDQGREMVVEYRNDGFDTTAAPDSFYEKE